MNNTITFDEFCRIIADHFGVDNGRLTKDISFLNDLGIDSLSLVNFIIKLERKYNIKIEMDNVWNLKNIGEAYDILIQKIGSLQPPVSDDHATVSARISGASA